MRRVLWGLAVLALVWSGWWAIGSYGLRSGVAAWFDARRAEGWQAEFAGLRTHGFPRFMRAELADVAVADPDTGLAIGLPALDIRLRALWPGDVVVFLPSDPIAIATPQGQSRLQMNNGLMALNLRPGSSGEMETLAWVSTDWNLTEATGGLASGEAFRLTMHQGSDPATYRLGFAAPAFRPGDVPRAVLGIPPEWPLTFDRLEAEMDVTFDRPWDRRALSERRPQPRAINLTLAQAAWADLRLNVTADLSVDEDGVPEGTVILQARNWRTMLDLAQTIGLLPSGLREQAEGLMQTLAGLNGNPETIDVQLNLRGGFAAVGIIPIGPAPRVVIR